MTKRTWSSCFNLDSSSEEENDFLDSVVAVSGVSVTENNPSDIAPAITASVDVANENEEQIVEAGPSGFQVVS